MQYIFRIACLALLFTSSAHVAAAPQSACPPPPAAPSQQDIHDAMTHATNRGFLWRISKDGRDSYLYGTIHVAKFDWMFPGPTVMQAVKNSEVIALELDMMDPDVRLRMKRGLTAASDKVTSGMPPALVARLRKQATESCLPYEAIAGYPGEMQVATITLMKARLDGLESSYAIDAVLAGMGHAANKEVISLETPESQIATLLHDDKKETIRFMDESLQEMESGKDRKQLRHIAEVWANSDYKELANYSQWCECMDTPVQRAFMYKLLDARNPTLADYIDARHRSGKRVFAAVGSLHMFGDSGLPLLMQQRDYRVERIDLSH